MLKKHFAKILVGIIIILVSCLLYVEFYKDDKYEVFFYPSKITYTDEISCEVSYTGGIYDTSKADNKVIVNNTSKDDTTIHYKFSIDKVTKAVNIQYSDSLGVDSIDGMVLSDDAESIQIMNLWGINRNKFQTFSINKETGFMTHSRQGTLLNMEALSYSFGNCR
jgi:hypothetical protein